MGSLVFLLMKNCPKEQKSQKKKLKEDIPWSDFTWENTTKPEGPR